MSQYLYRDYVAKLSRNFIDKCSAIETGHNFEYGSEFELVLCELLRDALPGQFGVRRGYVVSQDGKQAGDDIIIYEQIRFPSLTLRQQAEFAHKEHVPIEAVYCYIEAKHTLHLEGDDGQSLSYAMSQVGSVKELISQREPVSYTQILPHINLGEGLSANAPFGFPPTMNPAFSVIFARQVRAKKGGAVLPTGNEILKYLNNRFVPSNGPDILVLGSNCIVVPITPHKKVDGELEHLISTPFFIPGTSNHKLFTVDETAFGIGLLSIMFALDFIKLGKLKWSQIISDAIEKSKLRK